jgi:hypothetical protein
LMFIILKVREEWVSPCTTLMRFVISSYITLRGGNLHPCAPWLWLVYSQIHATWVGLTCIKVTFKAH